MNLDDIRQAFQQWREATDTGPVMPGPWFGRRAVYLLYGNVPQPGTVVGVEPHKHAVYLWLDEPLAKRETIRGDPEMLPVLLVNIYDDTFRWED